MTSFPCHGGDGIYCECYMEKISIKLSKFKIIENNINGKVVIVVMATSYEGLSGLLEIAFKEIRKQFGNNIDTVILDNTCSLGTKNSSRYLKVDIEDDHMKNTEDIKDVLLLKQLKEITCKELLNNNNYLKSSILTSTQVKMIEKGLVI